MENNLRDLNKDAQDSFAPHDSLRGCFYFRVHQIAAGFSRVFPARNFSLGYIPSKNFLY